MVCNELHTESIIFFIISYLNSQSLLHSVAATPMSRTLNLEAKFAYGSRLINPVKAENPGLVYDINEADYIKLFVTGTGVVTVLNAISYI